jgi:hypothetical protein
VRARQPFWDIPLILQSISWNIPCAQCTTYMGYPTHLQVRLCGTSHLFADPSLWIPFAWRPVPVGISHSFAGDSVGYPMYVLGSHSGISHLFSSPSPWDIPCAQCTTYMGYHTHLQVRLCGISHLFTDPSLWIIPFAWCPVAIGISHLFADPSLWDIPFARRLSLLGYPTRSLTCLARILIDSVGYPIYLLGSLYGISHSISGQSPWGIPFACLYGISHSPREDTPPVGYPIVSARPPQWDIPR